MIAPGKKKKSRTEVRDFCLSKLDRSGDFTGTHTPGTNIHMAGRTVDECLHTLHVGLPRTIGTSVGVGNFDAEGHALIAKLALCHPLHLLAVAYFHAHHRHIGYDNRKLSKKQEEFSKKPRKIEGAPDRGKVLRNPGFSYIMNPGNRH